jgi:prepilin-type N-terminal cleavage/methylation domain-containing protein
MTRNRRALTLLEVLIVVMLLAIIAAAAAPMFASAASARLRGAAQLLMADLDRVRLAGITQSDDPLVLVARPTLAGGDGGYHLARAAAPDRPIDNPTTQTPWDVSFGRARAGHLAGVSLAAVSLGSDRQLGFGLYGQLDQADAATFTLAADGQRMDITVHPTTGEVTAGAIY